MRRALAAVALVLLLGSCGADGLDRREVADVVRDAFADAGHDVTDVVVDDTPVDGRWTAAATIAGDEIRATVATGTGRIVALDLGAGAPALTPTQLEAIAAHDADRTDAPARRLALAVVVALVVVVALGLLLARRLRLREERAAQMAVARPSQ